MASKTLASYISLYKKGIIKVKPFKANRSKRSVPKVSIKYKASK